jgi:two-component system response regulator ChvI
MAATFDQVAMGLDARAPVLLGSVNEPDAIRALLIEDGAIDRGLLAQELSQQGFAVQTVASLPGAPDADVIVLHCDRAKISSIDLLVKLHRQGVNIPVVLLTDKALPAHECLALDKGAVDVICKSRGSEVLARRLKSVVKASNPTDQPRSDRSVICGKLLLRPDLSRAYWKDADLDLTLGEYNILHLLASNVGRYVTYRAIYDRLHYEGFIAPEAGPMAIGRMCGPPSGVSGRSSAASTRPSTRSRTTTASGTAGRSQTEVGRRPSASG